MTDIVDQKTRSRMMSGIRSKNTTPELLVRRFLHAQGFRFRIHRKDLPGKPDIVLPKYRAVLFVHGCFWHGHQCRLFRIPQTRTEFWTEKIESNIRRDRLAIESLNSSGWRVGVIWECALKGRFSGELIQLLPQWIRQTESTRFELDEHSRETSAAV